METFNSIGLWWLRKSRTREDVVNNKDQASAALTDIYKDKQTKKDLKKMWRHNAYFQTPKRQTETNL